MKPLKLRRDIQRYHGGGYFPLPWDFVNTLSLSESVVLASIINFVWLDLESKQDCDGWIRLTTARIIARLPKFSSRRVKRVLATLKRKGIIHTKRRENPSRRWVIVDVDQLDKWILKYKVDPRGQNDPGSTFGPLGEVPKVVPLYIKEQKDIDDEKKTVAASPRRCVKIIIKKKAAKKHCNECHNLNWSHLGLSLRDAIGKVTTVPHTSKPTQWGHAIESLHTRGKVPIAHIHEVLNWYTKALVQSGNINSNGNPSYLPVAFSGKSFATKFPAIVAAMKRQGGSARPPNTKTIKTAITEGEIDLESVL
jgi:hypothetical protein